MSYNFTTLITAIDTKAQTLAAAASDSKDLVYLGKAVEAMTVPASVSEITAAGDTKVAAVNTAGTTQVTAVNTAGTTQVGNVNTAGTTQVAAVTGAAATYSKHPSATVTAIDKTIVDDEFVHVTAAGKTVTLPASPTAGNSVVYISIGGSFLDTVLARNGNKIMGLNEDLTINKGNTVIRAMFHGATHGWRVY